MGTDKQRLGTWGTWGRVCLGSLQNRCARRLSISANWGCLGLFGAFKKPLFFFRQPCGCEPRKGIACGLAMHPDIATVAGVPVVDHRTADWHSLCGNGNHLTLYGCIDLARCVCLVPKPRMQLDVYTYIYLFLIFVSGSFGVHVSYCCAFETINMDV